MDNKYYFTVKDYNCEAIFDTDKTVIRLRKEQVSLSFPRLVDFKNNDFKPLKVGIKVITSSISVEDVIGQEVLGLLEIGCMQITKEEFNKLYKLIKFKQDEFFRQSRS